MLATAKDNNDNKYCTESQQREKLQVVKNLENGWNGLVLKYKIKRRCDLKFFDLNRPFRSLMIRFHNE